MRIGLVLEQFDPRRGGLECWTARFAEQLVGRGHEVHVVARQFNLGSDAAAVVAHPLPQARTRLAFATAAEATLRSLPLDVIHDMGAGWYCDVFHPHGGSWNSVTERKLLLQPRWYRSLLAGTPRGVSPDNSQSAWRGRRDAAGVGRRP